MVPLMLSVPVELLFFGLALKKCIAAAFDTLTVQRAKLDYRRILFDIRRSL